MIIQRSVERLPIILIQPRHDTDQLKTPTQQKIERETFIKNDQTKSYAQQSVYDFYKQLRKMAANTEYHIQYHIDELGAPKQIKFALKQDGKVITSIPPDAAIEIAEKAKHTTLGLLFDLPA